MQNMGKMDVGCWVYIALNQLKCKLRFCQIADVINFDGRMNVLAPIRMFL